MSKTANAIAIVAMLYATRRYYRDWGATKGERGQRFPGDELVGDPAAQMTAAIRIDAPASAVWPWLLQIGQDRGGLYLPGRLGDLMGLNIRNARRIHAIWQQTAVGDSVRVAPPGWMGCPDGVALEVAEIVPGRCLVLRTAPTGAARAVWSFLLLPQGDGHSRLLLRTRVALRHPGAVLGMELIRPAAAVASRAVLRGIKRHAEGPRLMPVAQVAATGSPGSGAPPAGRASNPSCETWPTTST